MTTLTTFLSNEDVKKYEPTIRAVVNRLLLSRRYFSLYTEREDLFQIGWVALIGCLETFDKCRGFKFETYASKAIFNAVNKELKRLVIEHHNTQKMEKTEYELPEFEDEYMKKLVDAVENSNLFTSRTRKVFWLRFIDEQSFDQIGKTIGVSGEYARRIYHSSVKKLKELMGNG
jgi:RNA polymerase sigma factor (sigma-70 family)